MERTAIFIDGAYLDKVLERNFNKARIDFEKFISAIGDESTLRTYYYHCPPYSSLDPTPEEQQRARSKNGFFRALSNIPRFQVRLGRLAFRGRTEQGQPIFIQKLVDVMLSVDMVQLSATKQINKVILVAGDNDFLPAVQATKSLGVLVSLLHGPAMRNHGPTHNELWQTSDERREIDTVLIDSIQR